MHGINLAEIKEEIHTNDRGGPAMKSRIVGLLLAALLAAPGAAQAYVKTFEFVCTNPVGCDGDAAFSLKIMLDSSVVTPGGSYTASSDDGLFSWSATSSVGNGFSISGTFAQIEDLTDPNGLSPPPPSVLFTFSNDGALSTVLGVYENSNSMADGIAFKFANKVCSSCYGEGGYISWTEPNTVGARVDGYTGGSIGRTVDDTDIQGVWQLMVPVPAPATLALLGIGLAGLGMTRRRKPH